MHNFPDLGPDAQPIQCDALTREVAPPSLTGVRSICRGAGRCDRCCWWEPKPRGADTLAGRCHWATANGPVPIWAHKVPRAAANQGSDCATFFPGTWESPDA